MVKKVTKDKSICPVCGRKTIYYRMDGSIFCRSCGHDSRKGK